ncbi:MAG: DNA repair protein RadC [Gammaproteobacteria bacterium]|nr:DNA repair protein RadC [Gammaproteobacteria bacterium]
MSINTWPEAERPREKLLQRGAAALSDAELLAIFLRTGVTGKSAVGLARDLLGDYGGLRDLLDADQHSLCSAQARARHRANTSMLQAGLELGRRYLATTLERADVLSSPADTRDFLRARLRGYPHEVFACLFLDNRHRVISFDELFTGTIDSASVHPREVVRRALKHNAAAVILAHNHPSGVAEPSRSDEAITRRLTEALALVDVRVLDHLVIGDSEAVSFAERGLL